MGKIQKIGKRDANDRNGSDGDGSASAVRFFMLVRCCAGAAGWCSFSGRLAARRSVAVEAALKTRVAGGEVEPRGLHRLHVTLYLIGTANSCYSDVRATVEE